MYLQHRDKDFLHVCTLKHSFQCLDTWWNSARLCQISQSIMRDPSVAIPHGLKRLHSTRLCLNRDKKYTHKGMSHTFMTCFWIWFSKRVGFLCLEVTEWLSLLTLENSPSTCQTLVGNYSLNLLSTACCPLCLFAIFPNSVNDYLEKTATWTRLLLGCSSSLEVKCEGSYCL